MDITAQRLTELHNKRPGHSCEVYVYPAVKLTRQMMATPIREKRLGKSRRVLQ
jgi:hypothetical protein